MNALWVGAVVLAAINGGSPAQRDMVRDALMKVPDCMKGCSGTVPDVQIQASPQINAFQAQTDRLDWSSLPFSYNGSQIILNDSILARGPAYDQAAAGLAGTCGDDGNRAQKMFTDLPRIMFHEFAHHLHRTCKTGNSKFLVFRETYADAIDGFLAIKFAAAKQKLTQDKATQDLITEQAKIIAQWKLHNAGTKTMTNAEIVASQARFCQIVDAIDARQTALGFPVRFRGDHHASENGLEYFAEALETLVYDPGMFCKSYNAQEQQWLASTLGSCISTFPKRAPCYEQNTKPVNGAGGQGGGKTLTK